MEATVTRSRSFSITKPSPCGMTTARVEDGAGRDPVSFTAPGIVSSLSHGITVTAPIGETATLAVTVFPSVYTGTVSPSRVLHPFSYSSGTSIRQIRGKERELNTVIPSPSSIRLETASPQSFSASSQTRPRDRSASSYTRWILEPGRISWNWFSSVSFHKRSVCSAGYWYALPAAFSVLFPETLSLPCPAAMDAAADAHSSKSLMVSSALRFHFLIAACEV